MKYTDLYNEISTADDPLFYDTGEGVAVPIPPNQTLADVVNDPSTSSAIRDTILANEGPVELPPANPQDPYGALLREDPTLLDKFLRSQDQPETFAEGAFGAQMGRRVDAGLGALGRMQLLQLLSQFYGGAREAAGRQMNPDWWKKPEAEI